MNIILIGMMGSAKSSVASILASALQWQHLDSDSIVEEQTQMTIDEIFACFGEERFRALESNVMRDLAIFPRPAVISLGGGAILNRSAMEELKLTGEVFYLSASPEHLLARLARSKTPRPLLRDASDRLLRLDEILNARRLIYEHFADRIIAADNRNSDSIAAEILSHLRRKPQLNNSSFEALGKGGTT